MWVSALGVWTYDPGNRKGVFIWSWTTAVHCTAPRDVMLWDPAQRNSIKEFKYMILQHCYAGCKVLSCEFQILSPNSHWHILVREKCDDNKLLRCCDIQVLSMHVILHLTGCKVMRQEYEEVYWSIWHKSKKKRKEMICTW